jgi:hypothetical protein
LWHPWSQDQSIRMTHAATRTRLVSLVSSLGTHARTHARTHKSTHAQERTRTSLISSCHATRAHTSRSVGMGYQHASKWDGGVRRAQSVRNRTCALHSRSPASARQCERNTCNPHAHTPLNCQTKGLPDSRGHSGATGLVPVKVGPCAQTAGAAGTKRGAYQCYHTAAIDVQLAQWHWRYHAVHHDGQCNCGLLWVGILSL